ncbi:hypothetical protein swp_3295 [Shewanella piezotolerans WP3]|uniref:Uncharacterized protein n=1 Tax=Shewanella piezotolerans (strain WP3 / JCM 13877) TaxID=225849 RepID=B8CRJ1_SHEPW|nr:hypothetical protein [Shewanella piezotolerans]ACJ29999.1 hypothetical protein swp_3295 [Shewanella piezotolerans WP3]
MDRVKDWSLVIFLSILYLYLVVYFTGIGAGVIFNIMNLLPMAGEYLTFKNVIVEHAVLTLPFIIIFWLFTRIVSSFTLNNCSYFYWALLIPYFIVSHPFPLPTDVTFLAIVIPRDIALFACLLYVLNQRHSVRAA